MELLSHYSVKLILIQHYMPTIQELKFIKLNYSYYSLKMWSYFLLIFINILNIKIFWYLK